LRPIDEICSGGNRASGRKIPSGFSVILTTVPPSFGVISSVTDAVPNGRPLARIFSRRGGSASSETVWSETLKGPKPTVWWNLEPGSGQLESASRITLDPTTQ
jgi:hypothetical protein